MSKLEQARHILRESDGRLDARCRARDLVLDAVGHDEGDPYLVVHAVFLTFDLGDLRESARYLSRLRGPSAQALHPSDAALVLYVSGRILSLAGRQEEARLAFRDAMEANPDEPTFAVARAEMCPPGGAPKPTLPVRWTPAESS